MRLKTMDALNECFNEAKNTNARYIGVAVKIDGMDGVEVIINSIENYSYKKAYYNSVYDMGLEHRHADGIRIVGCAFGNTYDEIEEQLNFEFSY